MYKFVKHKQIMHFNRRIFVSFCLLSTLSS